MSLPLLSDAWLQDLVWLSELDAERERKRPKKAGSGKAFEFDEEDLDDG